MIRGRHLQQGSRRRLSYDAWYEVVGSRLIITASVRAGERHLAHLDLEVPHRPGPGSDADAVIAVLVAHMDSLSLSTAA